MKRNHTSGMKYKAGDHYYMHRNFRWLHANDEVIIVKPYKFGIKPHVDVVDINGRPCGKIPVTFLRKRPR